MEARARVRAFPRFVAFRAAFEVSMVEEGIHDRAGNS